MKKRCYMARKCEERQEPPSYRYCIIHGVLRDSVECWYAFICKGCGRLCGNIGNYIFKDYCVDCGRKIQKKKRKDAGTRGWKRIKKALIASTIYFVIFMIMVQTTIRIHIIMIGVAVYAALMVWFIWMDDQDGNNDGITSGP